MSVKDYPMASRVYIDLDGPVANFILRMHETGMPGHELKLGIGVYEQLDVVPGAVQAVRLIERLGLHPWFLTKIPDENPYSATEKILWTQKHFPSIAERIILSPDKGCVGSEKDYLIDDHPEWANAHSFRGAILKFERETHTSDTEATWCGVMKKLMRHFLIHNCGSFVCGLVVTGATNDTWEDKMSDLSYARSQEMSGFTPAEFETFCRKATIVPEVWRDVEVLQRWLAESWEETEEKRKAKATA